MLPLVRRRLLLAAGLPLAVVTALVLRTGDGPADAPGPTVVSTARPDAFSGWTTPAPARRTPAARATTHPRPTPRPTRSAGTEGPRAHGTGRLVTVAGASGVLGGGPLRRYRVQVEEGLLSSSGAEAFAAFVQETLGDRRGWGHGGRASFQRVDHGSVGFTVVLAGPSLTDRLCLPLRTNGRFSCYDARGHAVINARRWFGGADSYAGHLEEYRRYVVSHEVGHALGHDHAMSCRGDGLAPTMMQQTKSLYGCRRNPWPYP